MIDRRARRRLMRRLRELAAEAAVRDCDGWDVVLFGADVEAWPHLVSRLRTAAGDTAIDDRASPDSPIRSVWGAFDREGFDLPEVERAIATQVLVAPRAGTYHAIVLADDGSMRLRNVGADA
jgi:hypothetical protein